MGKEPKRVETLADLTPDPKNARRHTPRNVGQIETAIGEVGAARSIVIDEDGTVLAGNATIEAAARLGIDRVQVVDADGETIIAVRRSGLTAKQKTRLALFDNRAAETAEWDESVLAELAALDGGEALAGLWTDAEMAAILGGGLVDDDSLWDGMPEFAPAEGNENSLTVHFADNDGRAALSALLGQPITESTRYLWFPPEAQPAGRKIGVREAVDES